MITPFEDLAKSLKIKLELRFDAETLRNSFIYAELERITRECQSGKFTSKKTDIGIAAVKLFDSGLPEDDELANDFCRLAEMYRHRI